MIEELSQREVEVLKLMADGLTSTETGQILFISHKTVKKHTENIRTKLEAKNTCHAIKLAYDYGYLKVKTL